MSANGETVVVQDPGNGTLGVWAWREAWKNEKDPLRRIIDPICGTLLDGSSRTVLQAERDEAVGRIVGGQADGHAVANGGVTLPFAEAGAAQCDAVIERHVAPDLRCLADHHSHAVVDEEAVANLRSGVNLDAGEKAEQV